MRGLLVVGVGAVLASQLATQAVAHAAHKKRPELIEAMKSNGCEMTPAFASEILPVLGIDAETALEFFGKMIDEGIAAFADDDETLLLLPPACKT